MKRSSCLSAMLLGLSVFSGTVALAAPPVRVAQAQPAGQAPAQPAPDPADPDPADPAPAAEEPAPVASPPTPEPLPGAAVTLGGDAAVPGADSPGGAALEPGAKPKARPWAGSGIYAVTGITTLTLIPSQQLSPLSTVDSAIWFTPRYTINDAFQLRGRIIFNYEFTNSSPTVTKNEPRFTDTTFQLYYRKIPEIATIKPQIFAQITAPTSVEARARTMIMSPGLGLDLSRGFEHVLGGEVKIGALAAYSHPFYQQTNKVVRGETPYALQTACPDPTCSTRTDLPGSGTFNNANVLAYRLSVVGNWGKWSPSLFFLGSSAWAYHPNGTDAQVNLLGGEKATIVAADNHTNVRQTTYFAASVAYDLAAWVSPELGYSLGRASTLTESSTYGNPFFDRYEDMRIYLGASIDLDSLAQTLAGGTPAVVHEAKKKASSSAL